MRRAKTAAHLGVLALVIALLALGMTQAAGCGSEISAAALQVVTPTGTQSFTLKEVKKMAAPGSLTAASRTAPATSLRPAHTRE